MKFVCSCEILLLENLSVILLRIGVENVLVVLFYNQFVGASCLCHFCFFLVKENKSLGTKMVGLGDNTDLERSVVIENGFSNGSWSSPSTGVLSPSQNATIQGNDTLSYANILRSRNKFADALGLYESMLEKDNKNVEAHIGKGICLQTQNKGKLAFDSFSEAIRLDPHNACALTHCGILHKDEGRLVEAAEV